MFRSLAQRLGVALLAICLATAPVLGAMPRCCQTGAVKGSGNCCCGPMASARPHCCEQPEQRSCCESAANEADSHSETTIGLMAGSAPCHCKALTQPPALVTGKDHKDPTNSSDQQVDTLAYEAAPAEAAQLAVARVWNLRQAAPPGISLQKIFCRWTV